MASGWLILSVHLQFHCDFLCSFHFPLCAFSFISTSKCQWINTDRHKWIANNLLLRCALKISKIRLKYYFCCVKSEKSFVKCGCGWERDDVQCRCELSQIKNNRPVTRLHSRLHVICTFTNGRKPLHWICSEGERKRKGEGKTASHFLASKGKCVCAFIN